MHPQLVPFVEHTWPAGHTPPQAGAVALAQGVMHPQLDPSLEQTCPAGQGPLHAGAVWPHGRQVHCAGVPTAPHVPGTEHPSGIRAGSHCSPPVHVWPMGQLALVLQGDFVPLHRRVDVSVPSPHASRPIGSVADAASPTASGSPWCEMPFA